MGLNSKDSIPMITASEAYTRIREWYQHNIDGIDSGNEYERKSKRLIRNLPPPTSITEIEIQQVFGEVISALLEWGYHKSDGHYKMAAYAKSAYNTEANAEDRISELKRSRLFPYLTISNRY